ncbi:hypothetical protein HY640_03685 [Candidatus Woesearchaeota archaeon]|nr:hypothetical protein [Candidatus Woesearchaeota archaeon]
MVEEEKKHIESLLMNLMGTDFVLQVLPTQDAIDYSLKGISTCVGCGKKFTGRTTTVTATSAERRQKGNNAASRPATASATECNEVQK